MVHIYKSDLRIYNLVTLEQVDQLVQDGQIWENGFHLEKWGTLGRMGHTQKRGPHLEK